MNDLSIIIVSWNTRELLAACLSSVFVCAEDLSLEVFVADNYSSDGSPEMVRDRFPEVRLIENTKNLGFAAANNQMFSLCSAEVIMLLNSDTIIRPGALRSLRDFLREHPDAAAVGPKLVHPRVQLRILGAGRQPTLRSVMNHYLFLSALFPQTEFFEGLFLFVGKHDNRIRRVEWLSGACLVVRKKAIEEIGPLSESFFMYNEDMEWCDRMLARGWALYHFPNAVVEHHLNASTGQNEQASLLPITTGRKYFIFRNHPSALSLVAFDLALVLGLTFRAGLYFALSCARPNARSMWRARGRQYLRYASAALRRS